MNATASFNIASLSQEQAKKFMFMVAVLAIAALMLALPETAMAGTDGDEFDEVWLKIKDWTQGSLGRVAAGTMILVGIIGGIARQSMMAFALGAGSGMGLAYSPDVIEKLVSATLSHTVTTGVQLITNGLGAASGLL